MEIQTVERYRECVTHNKEFIKGFFGDYMFLSNFWLCPVEFKGRMYPSSEHAYMYAKLENPTDEDYQHVMTLSCRKVKKWGQTITLRSDWETGYKFVAMKEILIDKFERNLELAERLLATGDRYLEETNNWGDVIWGVDIIKGGKNMLGKILMEIRYRLRMSSIFS